MKRAQSLSEVGTGRVVYLVGRFTDDVFAFLDPSTRALAEVGVEQTVVLVDDPHFRRLIPRFHPAVELLMTPASSNPVRRWWWAHQAFADVLRQGPVRLVQLHGLLACLVGAWAARRSRLPLAMHTTSGSTLAVGTAGGRDLFIDAIRNAWRRAPEPMAEPSGTSLAIERPIEAEFFAADRREARRPLIVTGNRFNEPRSAQLFAQLAVLLGDEDLKLSFNWIGVVDRDSATQMKAAGVGIFPVRHAAERAQRLAAGWVYLAAGGESGFPLLLAEAMAVGLPCVALDTPLHRSLLLHGESGYLCRDEQTMVQCIAALVDSPELRERIGGAARAEAQRRFAPSAFRDSLFTVCDIPSAEESAT